MSSRFAGAKGGFRRPPILAVIAAAIVIASAVGALMFRANVAESDRRLGQAIAERNDTRARQLAEVVARQSEALINLFDMALSQLAAAYAEDDASFQSSLNIAMRNFPQGAVNFLAVADEAGVVRFSSDGAGIGTFLGDRSHFRAHAGGKADGTLISPPTESRIINGWAIPFTKAIRRGGRFAGEIILSVNPQYLADALAATSFGDHDVVALVLADGSFLARSPNLAGALGRKVPPDRPFLDPARSTDRTFRAVSSVDGVLLNFAWKPVRGSEVVAVVGLFEVSELALVRAESEADRARADLIAAGIVLAALVVAALLAWVERQRRKLDRGDQNYRALMATAVDGLHVVDDRGSLREASASFLRMLGYDGTTMPSAAVGDWDTSMKPQEFDELVRSLVPGVSRVFETRHRRTDGTEFDVEISIQARDLGRWRLLYASSRDITARKAAEALQKRIETDLRATAARLSLVLGTVAEGVFGLDDEGRVMFANPAAAAMLGWPSPEAMQGRPSAEITAHRLADGSTCCPDSCSIMLAISRGETRRVADESFTSRSGAVIPVEYVVSPLTVADMTVGAVVAFHDISARKALENDLRRSNAELEQFAYVVSHDLRQPLRMISSYITLVGKRIGTDIDPELKDFLGFAIDGAKRLDKLILALLEYSRVGRGGHVAEVVPLAEALAEALTNLEFAIREAGATVAVPAALPVVLGNRTDMVRLFQNLVGNAVKYHLPDRPPVIEVSCEKVGHGFLVRVTDNGIGIAPDDRERVFGVFQRLVTRDQYEGTGIGLAICRKIVEQHGGQIWVEPAPGGGSAFLFTLPGLVGAEAAP